MAPLATSSPDYLGYAFAIILASGGLLGAIRRGSLISLLAGGLSGLAAAYGANRISNDPLDIWPSLYTSTTLLILMTYRFWKTEKFMPAGIVMILSLIMTSYYAILLA